MPDPIEKKKITLKTLQQQTFTVEIEESQSIKNLKEKIEKEKGAESFPVAGQKLIYAGKILEDDKTVKDCNIGTDATSFIVVMVTKPKAPAKPAETKPAEAVAPAAAAAPAPAPQPAETKEAPKEEEKKEVEEASAAATPAATAMETTTTSTATPAPESLVEDATNRLVTGPQYEESITNLISLGFTQEQCTRAMNRAFNNAERAAEYLLSGEIPDEPMVAVPRGQPQQAAPGGGTAQQPAVSAPAPQAQSGTTAGSAGSASSGENPLAFLRDQSQFQYLRTLVQTQPDALPQLLQQMGQDNPELFTLINQNQESFVSLLNEPQEGQGGGGGGGGGGGLENVSDFRIQVTPEDKAAIDRIKAMGFPEHSVIEAYFACDKNEALAVDFLLTNGD